MQTTGLVVDVPSTTLESVHKFFLWCCLLPAAMVTFSFADHLPAWLQFTDGSACISLFCLTLVQFQKPATLTAFSHVMVLVLVASAVFHTALRSHNDDVMKVSDISPRASNNKQLIKAR